jgi:hypothetical protein
MKTLTIEQCRVILAHTKEMDRALFVSLLLCGAKARTWTWEDALSDVLNIPMAVYEGLKGYAVSKKLTIIPFNHAWFTNAHWVNGPRLQSAIFKGRNTLRPYSTHEVTRRLKRYARKAGLKVEDVSLRTVVNTHHFLMAAYGSADEAGDAIIPAAGSQAGGFQETVNWEHVDRDHRLHGIGRRTPSPITA